MAFDGVDGLVGVVWDDLGMVCMEGGVDGLGGVERGRFVVGEGLLVLFSGGVLG